MFQAIDSCVNTYINTLFLSLGKPCEPNPCLNNGQCVMFYSIYLCKCKPGFKGKLCEGIEMMIRNYRNSLFKERVINAGHFWLGKQIRK